MRRAMWCLAVTCVTGALPVGAQAGKVTGRVSILERDNKPSPDLGSAVVYLEGAGPAARPGTFEIAISDKAYVRSEEHTSELQSRRDLVCRLLLEKKKK